MSNLTIVLVILVIYMVLMVLIGLQGRKHSSSMQDFLTAGKQGTLLLVTGSFMGSHIGNGIVVGGAEYGATYGIGGMWYGVGAAISFYLFGIFMARVVYRNNYVTLSDLLEQRYGDKMTSIAVAVLNAASNIAIMAGQIMAGQRLFEYIGPNPLLGAITTTTIVIIYSSLSGLWGVMMTDVIQVSVIIISVIGTIIFIAAQGGFALMAQNLPAQSHELIPFDGETFIMMLGPTALFGLVSSTGFQRTVSCKKEKTAILAPILGATLILLFVPLPVLIGMYGKALWPDAASATIIFQVLFEAMPPLLAGLLIASICAAVMSTSDGILVTITANIVSDIYHKHINPNADEKSLGWLSRISSVVIGFCALIIALQFSSLISLLSMSYTLITAGGLVMIVGAIFWKKATRQGAIASFIAGVACVIINKMGVSLPYASVFPLIPSFLAYVIVSLMTQEKNATTN